MLFTIRPGGSSTSGGFAITAIDAREALHRVQNMMDLGLTNIQILDEQGIPYDLPELERMTSACERRRGARRISPPGG